MAACVRVPSLTDAQFAISQLHRKKVGFKRILISHSHGNSQNPAVLRSKVGSILSEVPSGKIQLFKFREMFEKRFHDSIGVSDLYKMKELVTVADESEGRMVSLNKLGATGGVGSSGQGHDFSMHSTATAGGHYSNPATNNFLDNNLHTTYAAGNVPNNFLLIANVGSITYY